MDGVRYLEVVLAEGGSCPVYQAGEPNWPAPGPNYVRIGTSGKGGIPDFSLGAGLPLYARFDADPRAVSLALILTRGSAH